MPPTGDLVHNLHVPRLWIELVTLWFAGWCSTHWATPARANNYSCPSVPGIRTNIPSSHGGTLSSPIAGPLRGLLGTGMGFRESTPHGCNNIGGGKKSKSSLGFPAYQSLENEWKFITVSTATASSFTMSAWVSGHICAAREGGKARGKDRYLLCSSRDGKKLYCQFYLVWAQRIALYC